MPRYIELEKTLTVPPSSGNDKMLLWLNSEGKISLTNSASVATLHSIDTINTTYSEFSASISAKTLTSGLFYRVTDSDSGNQLYGGTEIILLATTSASYNPKGVGKFYNPKYDRSNPGFGIWDNYVKFYISNQTGEFQYGESVTTDNGFSGQSANNYTKINSYGLNYILRDNSSQDWTTSIGITGSSSGVMASISNVTSPTYASGSTAIWGGKVWANRTGNPGNSTNELFLDEEYWSVIGYNEVNYKVSWDEIEYDVANDFIVMRREVLGNNEVNQSRDQWYWWEDNRAILMFQWGNEFYGNTSTGMGGIRVSDSIASLVNFRGMRCLNNEFKNRTYFRYNYFDWYSEMSSNIIDDSTVSNCFFSGDSFDFSDNQIRDSGLYNLTVLGSGAIANNTLVDSYFAYNTFISSYFGSNLIDDSYVGDNRVTQGNINDNEIRTSTFGDGLNYILLSTVSQNTLHNGSYIGSVNLYNSYIEYNSLLNNSSIHDVSGYQSNFRYNSLTNNSSIFSLNSSSSYTDYNTLSSNSEIQSNTLTSYSSIYYNNLTGRSSINNNDLSNTNDMSYNVLNNNSQLAGNVLLSGSCQMSFNSLSNQASISSNTLDTNATINNNALFNNTSITGKTSTWNNTFSASL